MCNARYWYRGKTYSSESMSYEDISLIDDFCEENMDYIDYWITNQGNGQFKMNFKNLDDYNLFRLAYEI